MNDTGGPIDLDPRDLETYRRLAALYASGAYLGAHASQAESLMRRYGQSHPDMALLDQIRAVSRQEKAADTDLMTAMADLGVDEGEPEHLDPLIERVSGAVDQSLRDSVTLPAAVAERLGLGGGTRPVSAVIADLHALVAAPILRRMESQVEAGLAGKESWQRLRDLFDKEVAPRRHLLPSRDGGQFLAAARASLVGLEAAEARWARAVGVPVHDVADLDALGRAIASLDQALASGQATEALLANAICAALGRADFVAELEAGARAIARTGAAGLAQRSARASMEAWAAGWGTLMGQLGHWSTALQRVAATLQALLATLQGFEVAALPPEWNAAPGVAGLEQGILEGKWRGLAAHGPLVARLADVQAHRNRIERARGVALPEAPARAGEWPLWLERMASALTAVMEACGIEEAADFAHRVTGRSGHDIADWEARRGLPAGVAELIDRDEPWDRILEQVRAGDRRMGDTLAEVAAALGDPDRVDALGARLGRISRGRASMAYLVGQHPDAHQQLVRLVLWAGETGDGGRMAEAWWLWILGADAVHWKALLAWVAQARDLHRRDVGAAAAQRIDALDMPSLYAARAAGAGHLDAIPAPDPFPSAHRGRVRRLLEGVRRPLFAAVCAIDVRIAVGAALWGPTSGRQPLAVWAATVGAWREHVAAHWSLVANAARMFFEAVWQVVPLAQRQLKRADLSLARVKKLVHLSPYALDRLAAEGDGRDAHEPGLPTALELQQRADALVRAIDALGRQERVPADALAQVARAVGAQLERIGLGLLVLGLPHHRHAAERLDAGLLERLGAAFGQGDGRVLHDAARIEQKRQDLSWVRGLYSQFAEPALRPDAESALRFRQREAELALAVIGDLVDRREAPADLKVADLVWSCRRLAHAADPAHPADAWLCRSVGALHAGLFRKFSNQADRGLRERLLSTEPEDLGVAVALSETLVELVGDEDDSVMEMHRFLSR